jgi:hypothetical protein
MQNHLNLKSIGNQACDLWFYIPDSYNLLNLIVQNVSTQLNGNFNTPVIIQHLFKMPGYKQLCQARADMA